MNRINSPKISIVTPSYNQGHFIEETICSILDQEYPNLEYIIIDGGSTDNTVEIIKKYQKHLTFWVSEPDNGQSDAINKGFSKCTGEIINWVNSDDYLLPGSLSFIATNFDTSNYHMFASAVQNIEEDGTYKHITQNKNLSAKNLIRWRNNISFHQPGIWLRNDLVKKCGAIPIQYHYSFDVIYLSHYLSLFNKVLYSEAPTVAFRFHVDSKTVSQNDKFKEDINRFSKCPNYPKLVRHIKNLIKDEEWDKLQGKMVKGSIDYSSILKMLSFLFFYPPITWNRKTGGFLKLIIEKTYNNAAQN
jgi:glycosyltransferase involved in cell wall biosynthesis